MREHDRHAVELRAVRAAGGPDAQLPARADHERQKLALEQMELLRVAEEPCHHHRDRTAETLARRVVGRHQARQLVGVLDTLTLEGAAHPLGHVILAIGEQVDAARAREIPQGAFGMLQRSGHRHGNRPRRARP